MNVKVILLIFALASQAYPTTAGPIAAGICYAGNFLRNFHDFLYRLIFSLRRNN